MIDKIKSEKEDLEGTSLEGMKAREVWQACYNQELKSKKCILEYMERVKMLAKDKISPGQAQEAYLFIESHIEDIKSSVKPNTVLQLKKELQGKLGKFAPTNQKESENRFLKFFKEAYPKNKRYKEYTWVLMDLSKINDEQILHTLKYINGWCFKHKLNREEKKDIIPFVQKLVSKGQLKYINQIRSLEGLNKGLGIKVIQLEDRFDVKVYQKSSK